MQNPHESNPKVVVLGNSGTGKTSIIKRLADRNLPSDPLPTIGANSQTIEVPFEGDVISIDLWDTAGQETYRSIVPIYVRNATLALLVYDINDLATFNALDRWRSILMEEQTTGDVNLLVVGNKLDLDSYVEDSLPLNFAKNYNAEFIKVSAMTGQGIEELAIQIGKMVSSFKTSRIDFHKVPQQNKGGCC